MRIAGLQKLTLLDYPGELACTVFTQGCNLRCPYCQNADLVLPELFERTPVIDEEEFFAFLERRTGRLSAVAITGGEPTLHRDLPEFIARIRNMGFLVKLDTNGTNPDMLRRILDEGLVDYVAMDVKNCTEKYDFVCGLDKETMESLKTKIAESIRILKEGTVRYEFRTTVTVGIHTQEDIAQLSRELAGARVWYLQQYVESENLVFAAQHRDLKLSSPSPELLNRMRETALEHVSEVEVRGV